MQISRKNIAGQDRLGQIGRGMVTLEYVGEDAREAAHGRLSAGRVGERGLVAAITVDGPAAQGGLEPAELERRLLEMGFVEGAVIEVLHVGLIGGDPIAVRLGDTRIALRRREAHAIVLRASAD
jgi:ferrous iron transport protein A